MMDILDSSDKHLQRRHAFRNAIYEELQIFFDKNYISFHNNRIVSISTYDAATDTLSSNSVKIEFDDDNKVILVPMDCLDTGYFYMIVRDMADKVSKYVRI